MLKNMKISAKLGLGFGLVLLLFGVAVFFSWMSISSVQQDIHFLGQVSRALQLANDTNNTVSFIRAGIRDLRYSEGEEDIANLQNRIAELRTKIDATKRLYSEEPRLTTLALASDLESTLRNSTANLDKVINMIRTKTAAVKKLDAGIRSMHGLFQEIVDLQYKRTYDEIAEVIEEIKGDTSDEKIVEIAGDLNRKVDRVKGAEELLSRLLIAAWQYKDGLEALDANTLNSVTIQLNDLETQTNNFAETTKVPEVREKLNALRGAFTTFKTNFADVLKAFNESDPLFQALLKDGLEMVGVADRIMDSGIARLNQLTQAGYDALGSAVLLLIALAIVAIVVGLGIAFLIAGAIRKPLARVVELVINARDGDVSITRDDFHYEGHDELGDLGDALSEM
ncbi:MAG: MCP four helix bundle domain-containing protein, partial [Fretibacterium sp.]|nr:MCP four helix bundle domain-containing protein [Fretibacterium sp.]